LDLALIVARFQKAVNLFEEKPIERARQVMPWIRFTPKPWPFNSKSIPTAQTALESHKHAHRSLRRFSRKDFLEL
jgi:hypothetical protein